MKKYSVGDRVWWARCGIRHVTKTCPICFGNRQVTLVLGNEDKVVLPCDYCGKGYNAPTGQIEEYEYIAEVEETTITRVDIHESSGGEKREYHSSSGYWHDDGANLFDTQQEALAACAEIVRQKEKEENTRVEHIKNSVRKTFSWNAGYHLRQAAKCEKEAQFHRERATLCKARVKEKNKVAGST